METRSIGRMDSPRRHRRRQNFNEPGHAHELTFSCYHGYPFLKADRCCEWLIDAIDAARDELDFAVWAYAFMPEHVHLIVWPSQEKYDIAEIRSGIKLPVSRRAVAFLRRESPKWLDRITVRKGRELRHQFWQKGGGYDRNIAEPRTLQRMIDYIHLNPVRRRLVEQARDWTWSSAAWFEGVAESPLRLDQLPPEWIVSE